MIPPTDATLRYLLKNAAPRPWSIVDRSIEVNAPIEQLDDPRVMEATSRLMAFSPILAEEVLDLRSRLGLVLLRCEAASQAHGIEVARNESRAAAELVGEILRASEDPR